jgi:hypothetical protein
MAARYRDRSRRRNCLQALQRGLGISERIGRFRGKRKNDNNKKPIEKQEHQ